MSSYRYKNEVENEKKKRNLPRAAATAGAAAAISDVVKMWGGCMSLCVCEGEREKCSHVQIELLGLNFAAWA